MSLRSLKHLSKTTGFRLSAWYSGVFILSSLLLFSLAYLVLSSSLNRQDKEAIKLKLSELSAFYKSGGPETLEREATVEKKFEKKTPFFVRLAEAPNKTIFLIIPYQWAEFEIKELEKTTPGKDMTWIRLAAKKNTNVLEVASIWLTNGYILQVGKSSEDRETILRYFREIFATVTIPLILLGFAGGAFVGFRALQPIRHLINTIRYIGAGKMDARVPSPQTGDEFEELVMLFNKMVEKIETLIDGMRGSLDNVSHDLRTPLTRIRGIADMALQSGRNVEVCREALADCLEESEQILKMLNILMDISEAETGVMKLDREVVNTMALIEAAIDLYRYLAEEKGVYFRVGASDDLYVSADPIRMRQALANLLDNAIKYTPMGGQIDLKAYQRDQQVIITVKDSGIGIQQEDLPRIWERLYRCDQSRSQKGLGLGLSLVRAIVSAHNGRVDVSSEPGKGSTFSIYLPFNE